MLRVLAIGSHGAHRQARFQLTLVPDLACDESRRSTQSGSRQRTRQPTTIASIGLLVCAPIGGQQFEAVQSASIAARTANSAKARAKNINIALMAISHQQFVSLQPENLFHDGSSSIGEIARTG